MGRQPKYLDTHNGKGEGKGKGREELKLHFVDCKRRPFLEARGGPDSPKTPRSPWSLQWTSDKKLWLNLTAGNLIEIQSKCDSNKKSHSRTALITVNNE